MRGSNPQVGDLYGFLQLIFLSLQGLALSGGNSSHDSKQYN